MNGDHEHPDTHHGPHSQPSSGPKPLLQSPTATIYFDGLIYSAYNEKRQLYQAAILTQAEDHHLTIEVRSGDELLFPTGQLAWNSAHEAVNQIAPLWLFVDSGSGINEEEFAAKLHAPPVEEDVKSFNTILNFEKLYERALPPKPGTFAEFNFPHGISYSAQNTTARLKVVAQNKPATTATFKKDIQVSTLAAIDIDAVSNGDSKKYLVLAGDNGENEFFRFELEPGKHYKIEILNQPIKKELPPGHPPHNHENHFLQFYELFDLQAEEMKYIVEPPTPPTVSSPPCVSTSGDTKDGLG